MASVLDIWDSWLLDLSQEAQENARPSSWHTCFYNITAFNRTSSGDWVPLQYLWSQWVLHLLPSYATHDLEAHLTPLLFIQFTPISYNSKYHIWIFPFPHVKWFNWQRIYMIPTLHDHCWSAVLCCRWLVICDSSEQNIADNIVEIGENMVNEDFCSEISVLSEGSGACL